MSLEIVKQHRMPSRRKFKKACVVQPGYRRELFKDTQQVSKLHFIGAARAAKDLSREVKKRNSWQAFTLVEHLQASGFTSPVQKLPS